MKSSWMKCPSLRDGSESQLLISQMKERKAKEHQSDETPHQACAPAERETSLAFYDVK